MFLLFYYLLFCSYSLFVWRGRSNAYRHSFCRAGQSELSGLMTLSGARGREIKFGALSLCNSHFYLFYATNHFQLLYLWLFTNKSVHFHESIYVCLIIFCAPLNDHFGFHSTSTPSLPFPPGHPRLSLLPLASTPVSPSCPLATSPF